LLRRRVYLRPEGWYYCFVIAFVIGGAVLRNVNLLVALAGLMVAALILHWQLVLRSLSGIDLVRSIPPRICAGDRLEVEVTATNGARRGAAWALEYRDVIERSDPPDDDSPTEVSLLFPHVAAGETKTRRYHCLLSRRGIYRFGKVAVATRYPLGLVEGTCFVGMPDRLVVYPRIGRLGRRWEQLVLADRSGDQSSQHRRGISEGEFYALREWRSGDNKQWVHWRTSAKLGTLAVRQFEQRRNHDVSLLLDLWQPAVPSDRDRERLEEAISFAATAVVDLARHGSSRLTLAVASREAASWSAGASSLFAQELLEHLAVCRGASEVRLSEAMERLLETSERRSRIVILSTRSREQAFEIVDRRQRDGIQWQLLESSPWLSAAAGDFEAYFSQSQLSPAERAAAARSDEPVLTADSPS
jgi:uncharacterized protein (DUF58 family)